MSIAPTYVDSDFIKNCKTPDCVIRLFTVVASYEGPSDPTNTSQVGEFFANAVNISDSEQSVYTNPWYYFPTKIDDDIISVKITGSEIANRNFLWFLYSYDKKTGSAPNDLAFYVAVTQETRKILENDQENYLSFSFKKLAGIQCRFDTFDKLTDNELNPQPLETNNVFRILPEDHRHTNDTTLININSAISSLSEKYQDINPKEPPNTANDDIWIGENSPYGWNNEYYELEGTHLFFDGSHFIESDTITHNRDWIQNLGVSKLFHDDTTIATQEDELMLVTNGF